MTARVSNKIIGIINSVTLLLSILILGGGIWLASTGASSCSNFLQWPVIAIGVFLLVVSVSGFLGACFGVAWLMGLYMFIMFLLIILLFSFTIFAFVVTYNPTDGSYSSNQGLKEYQLSDYSDWMQKRVNNSDNWRKIEACIEDAKTCKSVTDRSINKTAQQFSSQKFSSIEWGCCKPPASCNFIYVNASDWIVNTTSSANNMSIDCGLWSNNEKQLCYECSTCKAGVLANLDHDWRQVAVINVIALTALIGVYSTACSAWKNNRNTNTNKQSFPTYRNGYQR